MAPAPGEVAKLLDGETTHVVEIYGWQKIWYLAKGDTLPKGHVLHVSAQALRENLGTWVDWPRVKGLKIRVILDWHTIENKLVHWGKIHGEPVWEIYPEMHEKRPSVRVVRVVKAENYLAELQEVTRIFSVSGIHHDKRSHWPSWLKEQVEAALLKIQREEDSRKLGAEFAAKAEMLQRQFESDLASIARTMGVYDLEVAPLCEGVAVTCLGELVEIVPWKAVQPETVDSTAWRLQHKALEIIAGL